MDKSFEQEFIACVTRFLDAPYRLQGKLLLDLFGRLDGRHRGEVYAAAVSLFLRYGQPKVIDCFDGSRQVAKIIPLRRAS